jgi:hypothetical protein
LPSTVRKPRRDFMGKVSICAMVNCEPSTILVFGQVTGINAMRSHAIARLSHSS